ncbi:MAG: hypothetical protein ACE5KY_01510, partial [Candidatus Tectimicrobiota bacterium]
MSDPQVGDRADLATVVTELAALRRQVAALTRRLDGVGESVDVRLARRGFTVLRAEPLEACCFPAEADEAFLDTLYEWLKKYSFRLVLRDMIREAEGFAIEALTRYCARSQCERYVAQATDLGLVEPAGPQRWRLAVGARDSFGETLEWFVAELFGREFGCEASWGITLRDTKHGGDYDVIAFVEGHLVYVEVKSAPPKHIASHEVAAFFRRVRTLKPQMAIFFEDTELRMADKVVPMVEEVLAAEYGSAVADSPVVRLQDELFHINHALYIVNARPEVAGNFAVCLRDFLGTR